MEVPEDRTEVIKPEQKEEGEQEGEQEGSAAPQEQNQLDEYGNRIPKAFSPEDVTKLIEAVSQVWSQAREDGASA